MATLEKIRSKSVFLIIVIGVALLAFIVGDALTNSRNLFGDHTSVAKIGGDKIDIQAYQQKREELNRRLEEARQQNPQQYANFDTQLLSQMAIDELINETLLDKGVKELGLRTSPEQLRFYVMDNPVNQQDLGNILRQLQQMGVSASTPAQAYEVIFNPTRNGLTEAQAEPFRRAWLAMEEKTARLVQRQTYQKLIYGTVKANDLDKKALYNDYVATRNVTMAYRPYGQLDEKKYPVSDAEVRAAYDKQKNLFKVNEMTKDVSFIAVPISPSAADRKHSQELAQATVKALSDSAATLTPALKKEGVASTRRHLRASDLPAGPIKNYLTSATSSDSAVIVSDNLSGFTIVKLGRRTMELDSIQLNLVRVAGKSLPAKVLARLNGGLAADSISKVFSADSVVAQTELWIPLFNAEGPTNAIESAMMDSINKAGAGYFVLDSTDQGAVIAKVLERKAPKQVYEYDEITYDLNPSSKTVNDEYEKFEKFVAANGSASKLNAAAAKAGYDLRRMEWTQSTPAVQQGYGSFYPESRQVIRWAMIDGNPGDVSKIYENKDSRQPMLYVVAVNDEYDDFRPVTNKDVKEMLTQKVRRQKAGEALAKQYKAAGKDINKVAAAMAVEPTQIESFRFGRNGMLPTGAAMGRVNGVKPGSGVIVVYDDNGVYAFKVNSEKTEQFPYMEESYEQQYFQLVNPDFNTMLRGARKYTNNSYKFEGGE